MTRYNAFISYSHASDSAFARAFQTGLEQLAKPWNRRRALNVFRDETDLTINPELADAIYQVIDQSSHFLLLASPLAAASKWVQHEVEHWISERNQRNLLVILTGGELVWDDARNDFDWDRTDALPTCLCGKFPGEPLWVDFRDAKQRPESLNLKDEAFRDAVATVAAELHGISKRDLVGEDLRQYRKLVRVKRTVGVSGAVLLAGVMTASYFAVQQQRRAEQRRTLALAQRLAAASGKVVEDQPRLVELSVLLAAESVRHQPIAENDAAIRRALGLLPKRLRSQALDRAGVIAFSPDSQSAAIAGAGGGIDVMELPTGNVRLHLPVPGRVVVLASSTGGSLAAAGEDGVVRIFDLSSGRQAGEVAASGAAEALAFSPDGAWLAAGGEKTVRVVETHGWTTAARLANETEIKDLAFPAADQLVAIADEGPAIFAKTGNTWRPKRSAAPETGTPGDIVAFSADGQYQVVCGHMATLNKNCRVSNVGDKQALSTLAHSDLVRTVAFSPDSQLVATTAKDGALRIFDARSGTPVAYLVGDGVSSVLFSPDSRYVAAAAGESLRVYRMDPETVVRSDVGGRMISAAFSTDGRYAAHGGAAEVFDLTTGKRVLALERAASGRTVALSADGRFLAIDSPLRILEVGNGAEVHKDESTRLAYGLAFSGNGAYLAVGSTRSVLLSEIASRKQLFEQPVRELRSVSVSADGKLVASGGRNQAVVYSGPGGAQVYVVKHDGIAHCVALSADGRYLASGGVDGVVPVVDLVRKQELFRLAHQQTVYAIAFSPDGRYLATGGLDQTARVFSLATGEEVARMPQRDAVIALLFAPGGRHLLTAAAKDRAAAGGSGFAVARHLLQPADLVQEACSRLSRNLTADEWKLYLGDERYRKTCPALP